MDKVHVIYGSTTGMTEAVAAKIANAIGAQVFNVNAAGAAAFDAELLVLGSSTWGVGDLQDDWAAKLDEVKGNFAGKKVAVFGLGDSIGFADSFCMAAETLATAAKDAGATLVGDVLKLDDTNEADQTDGKIAAWVETIKA
ncbi:MAG: flavodoxin domain-containing protein [Kiritimatiellae bacterium]|nr:flavodoxin domain-containing protein [Kiritimatiellia bacterium]MBQ6925563.1 flavodoxin domain-containing protein [Kiritimatiellia bacterium]